MLASLSSRVFGAGAACAAEAKRGDPKTSEAAASESTSAGEAASVSGSEAGSADGMSEAQLQPPDLQADGACAEEEPAFEAVEQRHEEHCRAGERHAEDEQVSRQEAASAFASEPPVAEDCAGGREGGSSGQRRLAPSHTADGQAYRRAARRYREVNGTWVKGKLGEDGAWLPEPASPSFASLEQALQHELRKTQARRASWTNLRAHVATRAAVLSEGAQTRNCIKEAQTCVTEAVVGARQALAAQLGDVATTISSQGKRAHGGTRDFSFFSTLDGLRALELKELLSSHKLAAVGKKRALVELAGEVLTEHDLDEFIEARSGKRARIIPTAQSPTRQPTLDALFAART